MLDRQYKQCLLSLARASLRHGLDNGFALPVRAQDYPDVLREFGCTFVTLRIADRLRGCVGALEPSCALVQDVTKHAYQAGFKDPRFPALTADEFEPVRVSISLLSRPVPIAFTTEADLLTRLEPHTHGLIIETNNKRATFLPGVWEHLAAPRAFLGELKKKAGFLPDETVAAAWTYTTTSFNE